MLTIYSGNSTIRNVDFKLLYQHFLDNGFEFLFEHQNEDVMNKILFNQKYSILCNLQQIWSYDGKEKFNDCYFTFELTRNRYNIEYYNEKAFRYFKDIHGTRDCSKFESCAILYNWRADLSSHKNSLNEIINDFENEEGYFKTIWESNEHSLIICLGLASFKDNKEHVKEYIEKISNQTIKTFLLNYYEKSK